MPPPVQWKLAPRPVLLQLDPPPLHVQLQLLRVEQPSPQAPLLGQWRSPQPQPQVHQIPCRQPRVTSLQLPAPRLMLLHPEQPLAHVQQRLLLPQQPCLAQPG